MDVLLNEIIFIAMAVTLGGLIKGLSGFGYAVVSTPLLALIMPVQEAVAFMIIPLMAANVELVAEADREELKHCLTEFRGLIASMMAGVTVAMLLLSWMPVRPMEMAVGLISVLFVLSRTPFASNHFERLKDVCFRTWEPLIGLFSGIIYGASNVGVATVAYLKSMGIEREKFVATLAAIILGISIYRVALAQQLGLFTAPENILISAGFAVPAVISVAVGQRLAGRISDNLIEQVSLATILLIGLRLLIG